jgi:mannitol-1-/sugar-/sorbitol-6-phosphatase
VLVDSAVAARGACDAWASGHGLDRRLVWEAAVGRRHRETVAAVAPGLDVAVEVAALDRLLADHEHLVAAMPGAAALLRALRVPWAVVTSARRATTLARFERLGLPRPPVGVYGDEIGAGKPDPEGYLRAAGELGVAPERCTVVEDAPAGIAAGRAAGCRVLALATTLPSSALTAADAIFASLEALASELVPG